MINKHLLEANMQNYLDNDINLYASNTTILIIDPIIGIIDIAKNNPESVSGDCTDALALYPMKVKTTSLKAPDTTATSFPANVCPLNIIASHFS